MRLSRSGVILWETLWILTIFVWWTLGAQIAVTKYWNRKLQKLQKERLSYDGKLEWNP